VDVRPRLKYRYRLVGIARFDRVKSSASDDIDRIHPKQKIIFDNKHDGIGCQQRLSASLVIVVSNEIVDFGIPSFSGGRFE
jgi:hypothetical protein